MRSLLSSSMLNNRRRVVSLIIYFFLFAALLLTFFSFGSHLNSSKAATTWVPTLTEDFSGSNGTPPNSGIWSYDLGGGGWGNAELETYTNSTNNVYQDGSGNLVIKAIKDSSGNYTSGRIQTNGKFSQQYGKFEIRAKIPYGQGMWPAFWTLGTNIGSVGWPQCGESDIMENIGKEPSTVHGTIHGPGYSGANGISTPYTLPNGQHFSDAFHTFTEIWAQNDIQYYVDGNLYRELTPASLPAGTTWVYNEPMFVILNLAVGGGWPGNPDGSTVFPQSYTIDYLHIYKVGTTPPTNTPVTHPTNTPVGNPTSTPAPKPTNTPTQTCPPGSFTQGVANSSTPVAWFKPCSWTASYVIIHYTHPGISQQNVQMTYNSGNARWESSISGMSSGQVLSYSFTYNQSGVQHDSPGYTWTHP